jgi:hypothetical protein
MTTPTSHPTSDREALSALFDGELTGDAARFALKRLDHDQDWRTTCDRWHQVGDALRGQGALLPATFPIACAMRCMRTRSRASVPRDSGRFPHMRPRLRRRCRRQRTDLARPALGQRRARGVRGDGRASSSRASRPRSMRPSAATQVASTTQVRCRRPRNTHPKPQAPAAQCPDMPSDAEAASVAPSPWRHRAPVAQRVRNMQRDRAATDRIVSQAVHADAVARTAVTGEAPAILASQDRSPHVAIRSPKPPRHAAPARRSRPWPRAVLPQYNGNGALGRRLRDRAVVLPVLSTRTVQQRDTAPAREGVDASTQPAAPCDLSRT